MFVANSTDANRRVSNKVTYLLTKHCMPVLIPLPFAVLCGLSGGPLRSFWRSFAVFSSTTS